MDRTPDAWTALRGDPVRFLLSAWPWRSLLYLLTAVPVGLVALVALLGLITLGAVALVVVVGVVLLALVPTLVGAVATVERQRLALVRRAATQDTSWRDRLRARDRLGATWQEAGVAVLVATVFWVFDVIVLLFALGVPLALLLAPVWTASDGAGEVVGWRIDTTTEAWFATVSSVPVACASAYVVTVVAAGQAALTSGLLDSRESDLAAAVADLRRSRIGLVDAFETERRRIERDLHDGAQQRLVALTMMLGRAELELPEGAGLDLVRQAHQQAESALEDLRATVRGIHPQVLADRGLAAAVRDLADRLPMPVTTTIALERRLASTVEAAAYFVVCEALTNVVRHAEATEVRVVACEQDDRFELQVIDDGVGGAELGAGSGLAGLALRLEALDGRLTVTSPPGGPTEVRMTCPTDAR